MADELSYKDMQMDYRLMGYHKKETFNTKGDFQTVEYYRECDGTTYTSLAVKETLTYTRDSTSGLLKERDMTIEFYAADGTTVIGSKTTKKYYDNQKGYRGNKKARENLLNKASMDFHGDMLQNENYSIVGVDTATSTFTIEGNHQANLDAGAEVPISGSTGNDGTYTVTSATDNGANTDVVVNETIPDSTADGTMGLGDAFAKQFRDEMTKVDRYKDSVIKPLLDEIDASTRSYATTARKDAMKATLDVKF